ncbi:uncharacterized protein FOMMEDRAFT_155748 [Fomitiporia mediterranea MF3/22]|uniref:uncharacterized protein n=1 Tax=Fomitiporia mediterranea (strain MF3/22) TaxID=694068 RepID=UPI00044073CF|nr:uncharacterized protein FOMMEDRAFT_155748 [Fomitiporia mediterranea MF3/22]EJD04594.1 hypothetical protein FOMMEDRAFT_155748 [Fomitiporia mediterranea MF3/22]
MKLNPATFESRRRLLNGAPSSPPEAISSASVKYTKTRYADGVKNLVRPGKLREEEKYPDVGVSGADDVEPSISSPVPSL